MIIEVTTEQSSLLTRVLEEKHRQLEHELWKTDHRSFKDQVRAEQRLVEELLAKLAAPLRKLA